MQPPAPPSASFIGAVGAPVSVILATVGVLSTTPQSLQHHLNLHRHNPKVQHHLNLHRHNPKLQHHYQPNVLHHHNSKHPQLLLINASNAPNGGNMSFWPTASSSSWSIPEYVHPKTLSTNLRLLTFASPQVLMGYLLECFKPVARNITPSVAKLINSIWLVPCVLENVSYTKARR